MEGEEDELAQAKRDAEKAKEAVKAQTTTSDTVAYFCEVSFSPKDMSTDKRQYIALQNSLLKVGGRRQNPQSASDNNSHHPRGRPRPQRDH